MHGGRTQGGRRAGRQAHRMEIQRTKVELSSDEPRSSDGSVVACNVATTMALQRAMLLLLRRYGATALLLLMLELAAMALLELVVALCSAVGTYSSAAEARSDGAVGARNDGAAGACSDGVATARRGAMQRCCSSLRSGVQQRAGVRYDVMQQCARARCGAVQRC